MIELTKEEKQQCIARSTAALLNELCQTSLVVNLGAGLPLLAGEYLDNKNIFLHTENGMIGVGPLAFGDEVHPDLINAGRQPVTETVGCAYTDACDSFGLIRGGHLDVAVLGAFEVDEQATLANWIIPGSTLLGVGGAMDLVTGARILIVNMTHTHGQRSKLVKRCTLPATGLHETDYVVTELAVFHFTEDGPVLERIHPKVSVDELRQVTDFSFSLSPRLASP